MNDLNTYLIHRPEMRIGDVFAFGAHDWISNGIKLFTRSAVSHVATMYKRQDDGHIVLIESTMLSGKKGVQENLASDRIAQYNGEVWWIPLSDETRKHINWDRWLDYMQTFEQRGVEYDLRQVLRMVWAPLAHVPGLGVLRNHENLQKVFCSELYAGAMKHAGDLAFDNWNPSDISPQDLLEKQLYRDEVLLKGKPTKIRKFNSRPMQWVVGATA